MTFSSRGVLLASSATPTNSENFKLGNSNKERPVNYGKLPIVFKCQFCDTISNHQTNSIRFNKKQHGP